MALQLAMADQMAAYLNGYPKAVQKPLRLPYQNHELLPDAIRCRNEVDAGRLTIYQAKE